MGADIPPTVTDIGEDELRPDTSVPIAQVSSVSSSGLENAAQAMSAEIET
jgi:hypothetical protein